MAADATARTRAWGVGLVLASAVCFGASGPFGKALIGAGLGPLQAAWLRIATAALILAIYYTEAVAAALIAWAVLGERLSPAQILGGVIVLTGAYLAQRAAARPAAPAPPQPVPPGAAPEPAPAR